MFNKDDVAHLLDALGSLNIEPAVDLDQGQFGLSAHLHDPVSGQIITLAQPHRSDVGQPEILLSPTQAAGAVASARQTHLHNIRSMGFASLDHYNEAQKQATASRALAHSQALERAKLEAEQAEAKSKAAADAAPKREEVPASDDPSKQGSG